ncbi:MAG TPA: hypothetical protein VFN21_10845 [Acidimicrobiales bacterium]|nr:hypothetical protein [Acidimicrobiales bacterium]
MIVALLTIHLLAFAIWVGNLVALPITVRLLKPMADPKLQAAYFPKMGRMFGTVGTVALIVAILTGAVLAGRPGDWSGPALGAIITGLVVLGVTTIAMVQARRVGKLRRALAHGETSGAAAERHLHAQVRLTDVGRAVIIVGTLVGVVFEAAAIAAG